MPDISIRWAPIPNTPQETAWDDDTPDANILFRGGWGAGKTMWLWAKVLKLSAINYPLAGIWTVPGWGHIKKTLLPSLEEVDAEGRHWFLKPDQFHYNGETHTITWPGGGPIQFATGEHPDSIAGPNMAWAAVDEPGSIPYAAWRNTVARVRHVGAKLRQKVAAGTNEDLGWLAEMFGPDRDEHCHVYQMDTRQNTELLEANPHYIREILANATEAEAKAYIEGGVANLTGALAHPGFDAEKHWVEGVAPADPTLPLVLAFDFNVDPMCCVIGQTRPGPYGQEAHVVDAVVLHGGSTVDQTCDAVLARYPSWPKGFIIYGDATGKARHVKSLVSNYSMIRDRLQSAGRITIRVPTVNPPVSTRLNSVNRMLMNALGQQRIYIRRTLPAKQCPTRELVRSLQRTQKKTGTDDVLKKAGETITHAGEAFGYWVAYEWPAKKPSAVVTNIQAGAQGPPVSKAMQAIRRRKRRSADENNISATEG